MSRTKQASTEISENKEKNDFKVCDLLESCRFRFKTIEDTDDLSSFIAHYFPDPGRVQPGLSGLMLNAVEHGNLGIGYEKKRALIESGEWKSEIERLQTLPEHVEKSATATLSRKDDGMYIVIEDCGKGFEWKKFMKIDPSRAGDRHGRGIAQACAMSFDKLGYNPEGNKVVAFVRHRDDLKW